MSKPLRTYRIVYTVQQHLEVRACSHAEAYTAGAHALNAMPSPGTPRAIVSTEAVEPAASP